MAALVACGGGGGGGTPAPVNDVASKVRQISPVPALAEGKREQAEAHELHSTVSIDKTQQSITLRDGERHPASRRLADKARKLNRCHSQ
jgi:hypothetical protein